MPASNVTAIERIIDIFEAFQASRRPLSLTELSKAAGIPKSSCHAIVATLTARGYLYTLTRPRALYPTKRLYDVARGILANDPLVARAAPLLEELRNATRETVILGKRQGDTVIYLHVLEGPHPIRYSAEPGEFKPLYSSSIGKALLGSLKEPELRSWLQAHELPAVTAGTLTDRQALLEDVLASRRRGYFVTRGENVSDVWAVAAFIATPQDTLAVAVAGPKHRMESSLTDCARSLVASCSALALQLNKIRAPR